MKKTTLLLLLLALFARAAFTQTAPAQAAASGTTPSASATPAASASSAATAEKTDAAKTESSKTDAAKTDATKSEPAKTDPAKAQTTTGTKKAIILPPEKAQPVQVARFDKPPVIDGKLDDEIWKQASVFKDFYQIHPGDNSAPSRQTEILMGYDSKTLYLAFRAYDEPDKVRATVARRDQIFSDDYIGGYLDTFGDQRRAYALFFNPLGVQADAIRTEGRGNDWNVDIVMDSKGTLTETGYTVEVAIPFKSLRYEAGKGKFWGAHFFRGIPRFNGEEDSWMPLDRDTPGLLTKAGRLTGLEGISTERTIEIIPSLTISETGKHVRTIPRSIVESTPGLIDRGRFVNEPIALDPGLTAKFGITPQMTLDLAVNPDFAQVEADQLVVTANQRFPIFYAERRPFFLEGIDIFQTRITAVHTRAIVDPDLAVKLTGKEGKNTFGLMVASDNGPGTFIGDERLEARNQRFLDQNATIGVLRLKRDVGRENTLGILATTYNFVDRHNHLGGFDGRFKFNKLYTAEFQVLGTHSRRFFFDPDLGRSIYRTGNSVAYSFLLSRSGRNLYTELTGGGRTRDYRADVGFVQRTNTNNQGFFIGWFSDPNEKKTMQSWFVQSFTHVNYDFQGRMQIWESEYRAGANFKKQGWFNAGYEYAYERLFEEEFGRRRTPTRTGAFIGESSERSSRKNHYFIQGGATPSKKYSFNAYMTYRQGHFDLDFGAGPKYPRVSPAALTNVNAALDPGRGGLLELGGGFAWQPTNALRTTLNFTKNRLLRYDTDRVAFDDNIISTRTTYQFTKFLFARARVDYTTLSSNVKGQFLFGWTPNPGTAFYVGYNDDMNRNGFNPYTHPLTREIEPGFRRNGRTFFIKTSYLIRRSF
ncbi:MAG TPA: DUF5916 domain-containing protein [Pyrinomonadaceae bacterium]|jgi:hypothetical protein